MKYIVFYGVAVDVPEGTENVEDWAKEHGKALFTPTLENWWVDDVVYDMQEEDE